MRLAMALAIALASAGPGVAAWQKGGNGTGSAKAHTVNAGNKPSGAVSSHAVTLTWTASTYSGGGAVGAYLIRRFDTVLGTEQTVGAGCAGVVAATTCTETAVPTGSWQYTVTPAPGAWRGAQSAKSDAVVVSI
jgi:hypothetical protein